MEDLVNSDRSTTSSSGRRKRQVPEFGVLPQVYDFVMAASVAAQAEMQSEPTTVAATGTNRDTVPMPMGFMLALFPLLVSVHCWIFS